MNGDILTGKELSERWGGEVMEGTLVNWRAQKLGPRYVKLGKGKNCRVVYRIEDVVAYEKMNTITPKERK